MRNVAMPLPGRSKCCTRSIQFNCFQSIPPRLALAHRSIHKHSTNIQWRPTFPSKPITALTAARRGYAAASNSSVSLRPYQQECLSACLDAIQNGVTRIGASLPTGAGKVHYIYFIVMLLYRCINPLDVQTTVFSELIHQLPSRQRDESSVATQSIVLVGTVELARQAAQRISSMHPQLVDTFDVSSPTFVFQLMFMVFVDCRNRARRCKQSVWLSRRHCLHLPNFDRF